MLPFAISLIDATCFCFFMHEWALAEAAIIAATQVAEKANLKQITEVTIKIGEMQQVERSIFRFALTQLKPASFKNAKFRIIKTKAKLKCHKCQNIWLFGKQKLDQNTKEAIHFVPEVAHTYIKCPKCGSPDFEIIEGRGIWLESVKGEKSL
jgi:hydrogenase nickel incorporation protein HypA/HybF